MNIDVYQDTICPWCRIGNKNLNDAVANWSGEPVTIRLRPFELRPEMPAEGRDFVDQMAAIKGDRNLQPMFDRVGQAGEVCDLSFRFDRITRMPNTLLSHVLIQAAPVERQSALLEAVHEAYFERGRDIGDRETLLAIAEQQGFDRAALALKLNDQAFIKDVSDEAARARARGISGVPLFVFNDAVALSGAQPPDALMAAMKETAAVDAAPTRTV